MSWWRVFRARVVYMRGSLHRYFGNRAGFRREHENAVRCFSRAVELDPDLRAARLDRGILFWREMDRVPEALADFTALLAADPTYGPALLNRGLALQAAGRFAEALADLEAYGQMPARDPEYAVYAQRIARTLREVLSDQGEAGEAEDAGK
ncbi:MAG: hypothetical protein KC418_01660 [Anaerolineales bacterium]|nr:hypothetical protein [Anaerolineales bacterium]MCB8953869.1 hypothetical protein [Ardenticatenales bacterium]